MQIKTKITTRVPYLMIHTTTDYYSLGHLDYPPNNSRLLLLPRAAVRETKNMAKWDCEVEVLSNQSTSSVGQ
jgi:hypothetical protein